MRDAGGIDAEPAEDERSRIISLLGPTSAAIDDLVCMSLNLADHRAHRAAGTGNRRTVGAPQRSIGIADMLI